MSADLEREAREAALLSTPMGTRYDEDLCCYDNDSLRDEFVLGYLAAATLREKEIEKLRAGCRRMEWDSAEAMALVLAHEGKIATQDAEIATLRARVAELSAKLEAVPVEEMKAIVEWELGLDYPCEASAAIDRWLATETKP